MKAILVIDMPENCWLCPLHRSSWDEDDEEIMICRGTYMESHYGKRPDWCPLKPMPQKIDANDWHRMFGGEYKIREAKGYGYNHCIDEIIGVEE